MNIHRPHPIKLGSLFRPWKSRLESAANKCRTDVFDKIERLAEEHDDEIRLVLVSSDEWIQESAVQQMYREEGTPENRDKIFERSKNSVVSAASGALAIGRNKLYVINWPRCSAHDLSELKHARYFDNNAYTTLIFDTSNGHLRVELIEPVYKGLNIAEICDLATGIMATRADRFQTKAPFFDVETRRRAMQDLGLTVCPKELWKKDEIIP